MSAFAAVALGFPTALFTFPLAVVVLYWLVLFLGGIGLTEVADSGHSAGVLGLLGLGGVPVPVTVSLVVVTGWFTCFVGSVLLDGVEVGGRAGSFGAAAGLLVVALASAWTGTRLVTAPLRRLFGSGRALSRTDFVGRTCIVRTGTVGTDFGQAEVRAADGSSALVQVRQTGTDVLTAGTTALIYRYDVPGEFFWIVPL
nr:hypothetical protein [Micromonospora sp. DSM 115978]